MANFGCNTLRKKLAMRTAFSASSEVADSDETYPLQDQTYVTTNRFQYSLLTYVHKSEPK